MNCRHTLRRTHSLDRMHLQPDQWRSDWDGMHDDNGENIPLTLPNLNFLQTAGTR